MVAAPWLLGDTSRDPWLPGRPHYVQAAAKEFVLRDLRAATATGRRVWPTIDALLDRLADLIGHRG